MFTTVVPYLNAYDQLIEADRVASHFVKLPNDYDEAHNFDDYSDVIFDYDYEY